MSTGNASMHDLPRRLKGNARRKPRNEVELHCPRKQNFRCSSDHLSLRVSIIINMSIV